ncbi:MAG TPA: EamA family transporter [Bacteroidota bacterium]|nr:EamA family transporter [Bacteroidota bacterium]
MNERSRIYFSYALICLIWGSTWLAIKIGLESLTPLIAAGCRFLVGSTVLFGVILFRKVAIPFGRAERSFYCIVSLTSFSVPYALVYWGEQYIPSGLTSIIFATYPFAVAFFSFLFIPSERPTAWKAAGIILGFIGIVAIFSNDIHASDPNAVWGMAAVLTSALLQGFSVIFVKKKGHTIHPFALTFVPMLMAAVMLLAGGALFEDFSTAEFSLRAVFSILYLGIFGSVVTFVSYFWLLKRIEAVLLSLSSFVTPIIAVILGALFLGEELSQRTFAGATLVLGGIAVANYAELRKLLGRSLSSAK